MPKIVQIEDGKAVREYSLEPGEIRIGRAPDNDIVLEDNTVSGHHAVISVTPNEYLDDVLDYKITDQNSTNGTQVNGKQLNRPHLLKHHDYIQLGQHRLQFVDEQVSGHESTRILLR